MESYIVIKKQHSEKKNKDYVGCYMVFGTTEYMISVSNEVIMILLNLTPREFAALEVGYVSPKLKLEVA